MKLFRVVCLLVFFCSLSIFSQEKYTQHNVSKEETISDIAKKYNVKPEAIYELNPDAINGIKLNTVLLIPSNKNRTTVSSPDNTTVSPKKTHEVLPKETVYGITKQYHINVKDLSAINPNLEKEGLKIGQIINIPPSDILMPKTVVEKANENSKPTVSEKNSPKKEENVENSSEGFTYKVLPKETYYSIAKKNKMTVAELQKANPSFGNSALKAGQSIRIPVKMDVNSNIIVEKKDIKTEMVTPVIQQPVVENTNSTEGIEYKVLPKETYYSIAKKNKMTLVELQKANPSLGNSALKAGQKIRIPVKTDVNSKVALNVKTEKEASVLSQLKDENDKSENVYTREVLPKETKYGIAKEYGITVGELEKQNPTIVKKLIIGYKLTIQTTKVMETSIIKEEVITEVVKIETNAKPDTVALADQLIKTASENIGTRYRSGGTTSEGFDCSGLMCYTFNNYDIKLPRSSIEMSGFGTVVNTQEAQKGDLIFFKTSRRRQINHVGMVVEVLDGEIKFIHSATHGGVIISSTRESYYEKNFAQINRVF